jgi:hypothetical protein
MPKSPVAKQRDAAWGLESKLEHAARLIEAACPCAARDLVPREVIVAALQHQIQNVCRCGCGAHCSSLVIAAGAHP